MPFNTDHIASLFENATEGFVITDHNGNIFLVNPSTCRMFGYSATEMVGQKIEMLLPSRVRHGHIELRDKFYKDPGNRVMGHGRDLHGQRKDGTVFPVEVSLSTYLHQGERYVIAFVIDITVRKTIEQHMESQRSELASLTAQMRMLNTELEKKVEERTLILQEALARLEQSQEELSKALDKEKELNEIKSRFVSMASHEFRTPLSTVLSSASLLKNYTRPDEEEKSSRHIDKIKGSVKHLNDLLEDFLSLGKLEERKVAVNPADFNIRHLVNEVVAELQPLARTGQLIRYMHDGSESFESDPRIVRNILINLLSNAIKFSDEEKEIGITTNRAMVNGEAFLTLTVQDHGIGIPADDQRNLFSSFFRGRNVENIQGTGLGLHIVKRYVSLLHGTIALESQEGRGTTISIELPTTT
ncbi:MAG: PAS domain S-box protein [Chitinophagaceae bacterium]|nr:MAG: PAS domain S-box protein [Chitinophagaceae bacterium]